MASSLKNLSDYDSASIPDVREKRFAIVVSEWNTEITHALAEGAIKAFTGHGIPDEHVSLYHVPGSFELPAAAKMILQNTHADAVLCLGCVIQGETRHFEFICQATAKGIIDVSLEFSKPVIFGVLTTDTMEQARERAGGKHGNKGIEAAVTAMKMLGLQNGLKYKG
jgi:6,7-dimethyl-8-ribityllumazine synthase